MEINYSHLRRGLREIVAMIGCVQPKVLVCYLVAIGKCLKNVIRTSSLAPADFCMMDKAVRLKFGGRPYDLTGVPFSLVRELYCKQVYFPDPSWYPKLGDLVLDLGANIGAFSLLCAKRGCRVIAVEMNRDFEGPMQGLLQRNHCAAMVRYVYGAVAPLPVLPEGGPETRGRVILFGADLQRLVNGQMIALAKVDIEGSEFGLVLDDAGWLASVQRVAMEVHPDFGDPVTLRDRLRELGFEAWLADKSGTAVERVVEQVGFCYAIR